VWRSNRRFVERDEIDAVERCPDLPEALVHCIAGIPGVVLPAREPLLLRRGDDLVVLHQRGRAAVIRRPRSREAAFRTPQKSV
jgi:hypothetical protein